MTTTTRTFTSQDFDIDRTVANIEKANARGAAKGLLGGFEWALSSEVREGEYIQVLEVTGIPLSYGGWTFLAKVERVGESFITSTSPWLGEEIDRSLVKPGECEHCGHNRQRNLTFLVKHEDGRTLNVGSTCMRDFLGVDFSVSWDLDELTEVGGSFGSSRERSWTVEHILELAAKATKGFGFTRSSEPGSTRDRISGVLFARTFKEMEAAREIRSIVLDEDEVANILAWLDTQDGDRSNYIANLKALVAADVVTYKHLGLIASLPAAYARAKSEKIEKEAKQEKRPSEWIGQVGDKKVSTTGTVVTVRNCGSYSYSGPDSYLFIWVTEEGDKVKTFSTSSTFADVEEGDTITVVATVKDHEVYNDEKVTVMTRSKVVA